MSVVMNAVAAISGQFRMIRGIAPGEEANLGFDLSGMLTSLLTGLLQNCFSGFTDRQVAESMVNPSDEEKVMFQKMCMGKARREIKRSPKRNPFGRKLSIRERNEKRAELASDTYDAMLSTAKTSGVEAVEDMVKESRA